MDRIYLKDIELHTTIGAYEWEQRIEQKLFLSLTMDVDCSVAGQSDQLADALDYGAVLSRAQAIVAEQKVVLIERLATLIAEGILCEFLTVQSITVDLSKMYIFPQVPRVGVVITRSR